MTRFCLFSNLPSSSYENYHLISIYCCSSDAQPKSFKWSVSQRNVLRGMNENLRNTRQGKTYLYSCKCSILVHFHVLLPCILLTWQHHALELGCRDEEKEQNFQRKLQDIQLWWQDTLLDPLSRVDATFETISSPVPVEESSNHKWRLRERNLNQFFSIAQQWI